MHNPAPGPAAEPYAASAVAAAAFCFRVTAARAVAGASGVVAEIRCEPALRIGEGKSLALRVVRHLISIDLAHAEVVRLGMREIKPAHGRGREHGEGFGQLDSRRPVRIQ